MFDDRRSERVIAKILNRIFATILAVCLLRCICIAAAIGCLIVRVLFGLMVSEQSTFIPATSDSLESIFCLDLVRENRIAGCASCYAFNLRSTGRSILEVRKPNAEKVVL